MAEWAHQYAVLQQEAEKDYCTHSDVTAANGKQRVTMPNFDTVVMSLTRQSLSTALRRLSSEMDMQYDLARL